MSILYQAVGNVILLAIGAFYKMYNKIFNQKKMQLKRLVLRIIYYVLLNFIFLVCLIIVFNTIQH